MQLEGRNNEENADSVVYFSIIIVVYFSITIYIHIISYNDDVSIIIIVPLLSFIEQVPDATKI